MGWPRSTRCGPRRPSLSPTRQRGTPAPMILPAVIAGAGSDVLLHVLLALAVVVALGRIIGVLFVRLGQPPVIGEVIAGILLGPSLLGRVAPDVAATILPSHSAPYLGVIAQLGVVLYMFLVGLELNSGVLRQKVREVFIAQAGILVPFVLGAAVA